jgi:hypothetical protein
MGRRRATMYGKRILPAHPSGLEIPQGRVQKEEFVYGAFSLRKAVVAVTL